MNIVKVSKSEPLAHVVEPEVIDSDYLDQNVQTIRNLKLSMSENYYALGLALKDNEEKCLWALRKKKSGEPKYKNFEAWARQEAQLGRTQVHKCIQVVENFSEDDVRRIGHTKLAIALQVPHEKRGELVKQAEEGASKRELEKTVAEMKGKPETITVAMTTVEKTIPMNAGPVNESCTPAYCLADDPWAAETLPNGVVQTFRVVEDTKSGQLYLLINRDRP